MDLIKTSLGIGQTIKNVGRFREILSVFARNGFDEFIIKSKLHTLIPGFVLPKKRIHEAIDHLEGSGWWQAIGYRLRKSFEELGPSFIKLGQLLATREDLFDAAMIAELRKLQNDVAPLKFKEVRQVIERSLGHKLEEVFLEFQKKPLGTASIGAAYWAKLKDGQEVVVKVRKPNIEQLITSDFNIVSFLVGQLEKASPDFKFLGVSRALDDFRKSIRMELNFLVEAMNAERIKRNLEAMDEEQMYCIPSIYKEYSTSEILVMDYLKGRPFNQFSALDQFPKGFEQKILKSVNHFIYALLSQGFFHADLHGGNFFLLDDGRIGIIDFGLMGSLSKKNRTSLIAIIYALVSRDFENLTYEFLEVAQYEQIPNVDDLIIDIQDCLIPYLGLSVQDIDLSGMVQAIIRTLAKHQLYLPREWFIIFRALMVLDGVGKSIGLNFNLFEILQADIETLVTEVLSKEQMVEEATWLGRDVVNALRILPRHLRWFLKESAKKKYALNLNVNDLGKDFQLLSKGFYFLGLSILASIFVFSGTLFIKDIIIVDYKSIPLICWIFWGIASVLLIRGLSVFRI